MTGFAVPGVNVVVLGVVVPGVVIPGVVVPRDDGPFFFFSPAVPSPVVLGPAVPAPVAPGPVVAGPAATRLRRLAVARNQATHAKASPAWRALLHWKGSRSPRGVGRRRRPQKHDRLARFGRDDARAFELGGLRRGRDRRMALILVERKRRILGRRLHMACLLRVGGMWRSLAKAICCGVGFAVVPPAPPL